MARWHLSLSSLFIILEGEQHWSATILARLSMNYLSCRFKTPDSAHEKRKLSLFKKRKQWICILPSLLLLFLGYKY